MQRADSLEKTLMLAKTKGRRRRGRQRLVLNLFRSFQKLLLFSICYNILLVSSAIKTF